AGAKYYNASQCMVITNSRFTNAAKKLAYATGVILWDRDTIIEKIEE
ncbi:MAG: restriction endonuclease, partial [Clostridia bacterium]|nr:restriction endonuclease [Clostridia bacterium]